MPALHASGTSPNFPRGRTVAIVLSVMTALMHIFTGPGYGGPWRPFVTGYLIDIILPASFYFLATIRIARGWRRYGVAALLFTMCCAVELLQFLGHPVFGRTADPLDLAAYAGGIAAALLADRFLVEGGDQTGKSV